MTGVMSSWVDFLPGLILGVREGLEAFLVIGIMIRFLDKVGRPDLNRSVKTGLIAGLIGSVGIGVALWGVTALIGGAGGSVGKIWESTASLAGLVLLSTFVYWMMKHGKTVVKEVQDQVDSNLTKWGVLFTVTLVYLVLQAGYLLGYAVHELLSALAGSGAIPTESALLIRPFDFQNTVLDHKTGAIGIVLNVLVGWYSRPEWIPFVLHYTYVTGMFVLWSRLLRGPTAVRFANPGVR